MSQEESLSMLGEPPILHVEVWGERFEVTADEGEQTFFCTKDDDLNYLVLGLIISPSAYTDEDYIIIENEDGKKIIGKWYPDGDSFNVYFEDKPRTLIKKKTLIKVTYFNSSAQTKTLKIDFLRGYVY